MPQTGQFYLFDMFTWYVVPVIMQKVSPPLFIYLFFVGNIAFILHIFSALNTISMHLLPHYRQSIKISFLFLTEHILIDSATNEKSFAGSEAAICFGQRRCLSLRRECVQMALKADLMSGLRHQKSTIGELSASETVQTIFSQCFAALILLEDQNKSPISFNISCVWVHSWKQNPKCVLH